MPLTKLSSSIIGANVVNNTHIANGAILTRHFDSTTTLPIIDANTYNTYQTLVANDWNTLLTTRANDWTTLLFARANDHVTFSNLSWTVLYNSSNIFTNPKVINFTGTGVIVSNVDSNITVSINGGGDGTISNEYNTYLSALANDYSTYTNLSSSILQPKYNSNISTGTSNCFFVRVGAASPVDVSKVYVSLNGIQQINGFDYIYNSGNDTIQFTDSSIPADLNVHIMAFTT